MIEELQDDPVALLLPDASVERRARATRLTTALRIFASDALDSGSPSVHVQLGRAKDELEGHRVAEIRASLRDVLRHVAARCVASDSYVSLSAPEADYTSAWERLLDRLPREERRGLALEIPAPGANALDSLRSLSASFERFAARTGSRIDAYETSLWRARHVAAAGDAEHGIALFEELLGTLAAAQDRAARAIRSEALADVLALQLDAGRLDHAGDTIRRTGPVPERAADCVTPLHALVLMTRWARGAEGLPRLEALFGQTLGGVPRAWQELVAAVVPVRSDESSSFEDSTPAISPASGAPIEAPTGSLDRRAVGAQALVVLEIGEDGRTRRVHADVAPALAPSLAEWASRRQDAIVSRGTIEHDVVRTGVAGVLLRCAERASDGEQIERLCIDGSVGAPCVIAVEPVHDGDEVIGLVWMEFAHRLLPSAARRRSLAGQAGTMLRSADRNSIAVRVVVERGAGLDAHGLDARAELAAVWTDVVHQVGLKTAERRWIAFDSHAGTHSGACSDSDSDSGSDTDSESDSDSGSWAPGSGAVGVTGGALAPVASGGDGAAALGEPTEDGAWAVRRALRTGGHVRYGDHDLQSRPMLHAGAVTGAALALRHGADVRSVLVIESARRGDARESDVARWYERLQEHADRIECATVHARDRTAFDGGFVTDIDAPDARARVGQLRAVGRRRVDVLIRGEEGSGRRTVARWIAHVRHRGPAAQCSAMGRSGLAMGRSAMVRSGNGRQAAGRLVTLSAFGLEPEQIRSAFERASAVVVSDVDWLTPAAQAELARQLAAPVSRRPALLATLSEPTAAPHGAAASGARSAVPTADLHPDLLRRLERVVLRTTPLREARHEIPVLARFLARRFLCGQVESHAVDVIDDAALAGLWRQVWVGNVAALDGVLHAVLLRADGATVHVDDVRAVLREIDVDFVARLPSREPRARDVASAAWTTRTATGRINKTRAALYLGWDPNTLSGRMRDLGIDDLGAVARILGPADVRS